MVCGNIIPLRCNARLHSANFRSGTARGRGLHQERAMTSFGKTAGLALLISFGVVGSSLAQAASGGSRSNGSMSGSNGSMSHGAMSGSMTGSMDHDKMKDKKKDKHAMTSGSMSGGAMSNGSMKEQGH